MNTNYDGGLVSSAGSISDVSQPIKKKSAVPQEGM